MKAKRVVDSYELDDGYEHREPKSMAGNAKFNTIECGISRLIKWVGFVITSF